MYLGISGNNQLAQMLSVCDCCFFPGGQLAPPVLSWLSLVMCSGPGGSEVGMGFRLFTWRRPRRGSTPCLACPPLQSRHWTWAPRGVLDASVLLLRAWAWRASCHVVLSAVVVRWSWESMTYTTTRKTHLSPERVLSWGTWGSDSRPRAWGLHHVPVLTGRVPQDVLAVLRIGLIGDGAD